jgi:hypothetical protein
MSTSVSGICFKEFSKFGKTPAFVEYLEIQPTMEELRL